MKIPLLSVGLLALALSSCSDAHAPSDHVSDVTQAFVLHGPDATSVLAYEEASHTVRLFDIEADLFVERASIPAPGTPQKATMMNGEIVVGYGYGRGRLNDPIQIIRYDENLANPVTLFTRTSERGEVTTLQSIDDRLLVGFFTSKYETVVGWLQSDGTIEEIRRTRLGMHYDMQDGLIVQGRPYGDALGEDGDVLLLTEEDELRLPSFRGVQSVRFGQADDDADPEIFIGDGWHQNYGQFAEPRLSMLDKQGSTYALETLAILTPQYAVNDIVPFEVDGRRYLFASGNARADIVDLMDTSVQPIVQSDDPYFRAHLLDVRDTTLRALVTDQSGIRIVDAEVE